MNRITIAIIGAGQMAKIYAERAKELNIRTLCFAWEDGAVAKDYVDVFYNISIFDKDKILMLCEKEGIKGILYTTELTISVASFVAEKLKLYGNSYEISMKITNKFWVREKTRQIGIIKYPEYFFIPDINCVEKFLQNNVINYPVIVKPVSAGGKKGITVVYSKEYFLDSIEYAFSSITNSDGIMIEEFIDQGIEYSVESYSFNKIHNIIQITQKDSGGAPHCVELGHHQPAQISETIWKKIEDGVVELMNCLGLVFGPCHTEIKIIGENIYLIEMNGRPGGDHITFPLTELSTGYKYVTAIILGCLGIYLDPKIYKGIQKYAGIYFVTAQTKHLKPVLDTCENESWFYKKDIQTEELIEIKGNQSKKNYFIYLSDHKIIF